MIIQFIIHQWKQAVRSILWQRNLAGTIFLGIIISLLVLNLLGLGLFIDRFFETAFPGENPATLVNGVLLYYFCLDILIRFFLQKSSGLHIRPYLILPVSRKSIIHYVLIKNAFSLFNVLPFFILIPFSIKIIAPHYSGGIALVWLSACLLILLGNGYVSHLLKNLLMVKPVRVVLAGSLLVLLILMDKADAIQMSLFSAHFFDGMLVRPCLVLFPLLYMTALYRINARMYGNHLYGDRWNSPRSLVTTSGAWSGLERSGDTGAYIALELKMLHRNKRTRSTLVFAGIMLLVAPLFYMSLSREMDYYPAPEAESNFELMPADGTPSVTFRVIPGTIPEGAHVYITGDHPRLGPWKPSKIPLFMNADSTWSRTFSFEKGTKLRYIHTLGSWKTECGKNDGREPDVRTVAIESDTTITWAYPAWKTPSTDAFVDTMMVYLGLLFTGFLMITYGQFMLSWESSHFDLFLVRGTDFVTYFRAKYILLVMAGLMFYLLTTPLGYFGKNILVMNSALALYNIGINPLIMLFLCTYTRKRMDLNASILSTQGKGSIHYSMILPTILLPVFIFLPMRLMYGLEAGLITLAVLGLLALPLHRPVLTLIQGQLSRQRYKITAGFHQP